MKHVWDLVAALGLLLLAVGLWWLSPPWCLVVMGILALALAVLGGMRWA